MSKNHYPGANRTAQYWGGKFVGSSMDTNCVCLHTTETSVWPGYGGGASAPHMTILPNIKAQTVSIRQHFPAGKSSRALVNLAGGVQTNTLNVFQIELIGTCDSRYRESRKEWGKAGVDYIYWPDAPDWLLAAIAPVFGWLDAEWPDFKIVDATPRGWVRYPDSYGINARQRMTAREWAGAFGIFGHQHVPENCVTADTPILMGDCSWRPAGELVTGDRLVGFDEENTQVGSTAGRRFREAVAIVHGETTKDCYRVTMTDGRSVIASADHKWLTTTPSVLRGPRVNWTKTEDLAPSLHRLKSVGEPWAERTDKNAGWMAGAIDCDGAVVFNKVGDAAVLFGQSIGRTDVLDRFRHYLVEHKIDSYELTRSKPSAYEGGEFTDIRIKGGLWSTIKLLAQLAPEKFEAVRDNCWVNRVVGKTTAAVDIATVEHLGLRKVVSLETSARTYVTNGLLCHNTHGDPGNFPIDRLIAAATGKPPVVAPDPTPPPAPKPQTAVWDLPSTWEIGSTGDAVTKLGQRLVIWAKHLGLPAPYKVGPGPEFTETDRAAVAAFQRAQGWTGEDADGFPGPETFKRLAATPQPDPEPTTGPVVTSASLNAGSYNATGAKTYKARTDRYVNRRLRQLVDVLNLQEVGNGLNRPGKPNARMRARLDKGFGDTYRRHIGSDGRYNYSNQGTVKPIKSGVITAAKTAWYRGDNKQASYLVFEKNGVRGMDVSFHLENESGAVADRKRVDQMLSILKQALKIATAEGVDIRNILFVGDTNSEGMVADAMAAARWRNVATGTEYENDRTFTGWDGKSSKRFDYGFVYQHAGPATVIAVDADTDVSDHAELVIRRALTAK